MQRKNSGSDVITPVSVSSSLKIMISSVLSSSLVSKAVRINGTSSFPLKWFTNTFNKIQIHTAPHTGRLKIRINAIVSAMAQILCARSSSNTLLADPAPFLYP